MLGSEIQFAAATIAPSHSPLRMAPTAICNAYIEEEHAVLVAKLNLRRNE